MSTMQGPPSDHRVGELRSIANAIEIPFPEHADLLREVAATLPAPVVEAITAERDEAEVQAGGLSSELERAEAEVAALRDRRVEALRDADAERQSRIEVSQENAALREQIDRVKALAASADYIGAPGDSTPTRETAVAVLIKTADLAAALGVTE